MHFQGYFSHWFLIIPIPAYAFQEIFTENFTETFNRAPGGWAAYTIVYSENGLHVVMLIPHCPLDLTHSIHSVQGKKESKMRLFYFRYS